MPISELLRASRKSVRHPVDAGLINILINRPAKPIGKSAVPLTLNSSKKQQLTGTAHRNTVAIHCASARWALLCLAHDYSMAIVVASPPSGPVGAHFSSEISRPATRSCALQSGIKFFN